MIFVTVGTHEQQFNRLIESVDEFVSEKIITEEVFVQKGYSDYNMKFCRSKDMIGYNEMVDKTEEASIVITHGGPGSIMLALSMGKIPIVCPRNPKYEEHVDNHQILFTQRLQEEKKIIAVYEKEELREALINYDVMLKELKQFNMNSNREKFIEKLECVVEQLMSK